MRDDAGAGVADAPAFRMEPPGFLRDRALRSVLAALPQARLVGGAVRDAIAGRAVADIDLATPLAPEAVVAALDAAGLRHAATGLKHGTVTAIAGGRGFEVTTLRRDEATDGRHAEVAWTTDWREDAARRDFTINAMSMRPDGAVWDYFGGRDDLRAGRVRFVGEPATRIAEDYLRVLRFFRFQGRYGAGDPDAATEAALRDGAGRLGRLSVERVWSELKRILLLADPLPVLRLMARLGILDAVLPGGTDVAAVERLVAAGAPAEALLRLAALQPGVAVAGRLKLSKAEVAVLEGLDGPVPDPAWNDDALRRALEAEAPAALVGRSWIAHGAAGAGLRARLADTPRPVFPLGGRDAVRLGVPAGARVGALLRDVHGWWRASGCVAGRAECLRELERLAGG